MTKLEDCKGCPLYRTCPYTNIFETPAPTEHELQKFSQVPNGYIIEPPAWGERLYAEGEKLTFSLVLFGRLIDQLPLIAFAFNSSQYQKIANILWMLPENLSGLLGTSTYTASALDTQSNNILTMMENIFAYAAELDVLQVSDKLMLYIGGSVAVLLAYLFFIITFAYYLIAKLSLAMVILIGPLFIGSMLFPATRQWGMNWIGQILNYSVTVVFFVILGSLQNDFFQKHLQSAVVGEIASVAQVVGLIPLFFLSTTIFILVAWSIPSIASALTGGASVNGFSRTVMSMARWAKGVKLPGGNSVKPK